jgi:hypothetical protein
MGISGESNIIIDSKSNEAPVTSKNKRIKSTLDFLYEL